ncbi:MAG: hypothetical protein P8177_10080 [Gemmatimonadota bacterium]|jgi:uncharacterized protein YqfA (UPF0365 family)
MKPTLRLVAVAMVAVSTAGCFTYVPVGEVPARATPVQVHLNRPLPMPLEDITANNIVMVRGEVITDQQSELALSAFTLKSASDFEYLAGGQTVFIPRDALGAIEQKRLAVGRTALATAAVVSAGILIDWGLRQASGSGEGGDPPPSAQ